MSNARQNGYFSGRKALVVGGSGGIGRAISVSLAKEGANVTVHGGSNGEKLEKTLNEIQKSGGTASGFLCSALEKGAAKKIYDLSPDPDILVCAWGPFSRAPLDELDTAAWEETVLCNLAFPGSLVSLALGGMKKRNFGRILLFGGTNTDTIRGFLTTAAYSAAKTALGVLTKSAVRVTANCNVTCNLICPGLTNTEYLNDEQLNYNREKTPGGIALETADIADAAMAIMMNPALNGAIIPIDKGLVI